MDRNTEPSALVRALESTLRRMGAASSGLSAEALVASPPAGGWSPNEVLWHIRATADAYGEHIARILHEDEPRWRHVSPRARMKKSRYDQLPFAESFEAFNQQRTALLTRLEGLEPQAWERVALVKVEQKEWRLTLHERVRGLAHHEYVHCEQFEQVAAALRTAG